MRHRLFELLDDGERVRSLRFVRDADQLSYTAAHAGLRLILAAALGARPDDLTFVQGEFGKPRLAAPNLIDFNMSHSGGIVLIALASGMPLGVDVEAMRALAERGDIVRSLHLGEARDLAELPPAEAEAAFFRCWTRKEAVVKALGRGMNLDLDRYRVAARPGDAPAVLELEGETAPNNAWSVIDLEPAPGYVGAVAARTKRLTLSCGALDLGSALTS
jgi:4'-phosphopantetheinyl transferase